MSRNCDAFISYTRQQGATVAERVFKLLKDEGLKVWQDRIHMRGGEDFWHQIEAAIERTHYLIMVVTPDAFEGDRPVLRDEWLTARRRGCSILPVEENSAVDFSSPEVPPWLRKLDCYDLDNDNHRQKLLNDLRTTPEVRPVPHNVEFPANYVRREHEMREVVRLLMATATGGRVAITTALRGAGGFGKTTLAKAVCFEDEVLARYTDGVLWLSVGEGARGVPELLAALLSQLGEQPKSSDRDTLFGEWKEALRTRQCLIVLDDVWRESDAQSLVVRETSSAFLVTTRIPRVASAVDAADCLVDAMTPEQSIALLTAALGGAHGLDESLNDRLKGLAGRAGFWPVLLGLIEFQLRLTMRRQGASPAEAIKQVEEDLQELGLTAFDRNDPNQRSAAVKSTVEASLRYLESTDSEAKPRYYELAVFPDDVAIPLKALQDLWNLSPNQTRRLAERFDDSGLAIFHLERGLNVHDVFLHYLRAKRTPDDLASLHRRLISAWPEIHRLPYEYAWRWYGWHCIEANEAGNLARALLDLDWLKMRLQETDLGSLLADCHRAKGPVDGKRHSLSLLEEALEKSAHVLLTAPRQLANQLYGRLRDGLSGEIDALLHQAGPLLTTQELAPLIQSLQPVGSALRRTLRGHENSVWGALALADGRLLSWSLDGTLRLWSSDGAPLVELRGHEDSVDGALALADGRLLSWSTDRTLRLWSSDGAPLVELRGHGGSVRGALVLADGRLLSWSDDRTLRLWSSDGAPLVELRGHGGSVRGALALADGRLLSWSDDRTLRLWSSDGAPLVELRGHGGSVRGALVLADGQLLSWSDDRTLRLWSSDGAPLVELRGHEGSVDGALALADGRLLSWSFDGTLRLWSSDGAPLVELRGHEGLVDGALALADGRLLSWSDDRTLRLWSSDGAPLVELRGHEDSVRGALVLADGRLLSWSDDRTLRLWSSDGAPLVKLRGHESSVDGALALADGRLLSWSFDGTLRLWSSDGAPLVKLRGHGGSVRGALALADGRLLSWSTDRTLRLWSSDGAPLVELCGHEDSVIGALALADGRLLSWSTDRTLRLWSSDGAPLVELRGHEGLVDGALALADGRLLSWSFDGTLRLWSSDGAPLVELRGHGGSVRGALALADGRLLSWSDDRTLRLWSSDGAPLVELCGHGSSVLGALALADGRLLSWSYDRTPRLWSSDGASLVELRGHGGFVYGALVLADGRLLSWSDDRTLRLWSSDGAPLVELRGHGGSVRGALALADGRLLSWSYDRTPRLWSSDGAPLVELRGHEDAVNGALALADGRLLSWSFDGTLRLWDLATQVETDALYFDAGPTVVIALASERVFVGDALGSVHWVRVLPVSAKKTAQGPTPLRAL